MNKYKSIQMSFILLVVLVLFLLIWGFRGKQFSKNSITIGILQTASHPGLILSRDSFIEEAKKLLGADTKFIIQNAEGSPDIANQIAKDFHENDTIVGILTLGTLATKMMAFVEKQKPIFFSAVSDPKSIEVLYPGTNVVGVQEMVDVKMMILMASKLFPTAKKVAILFNPDELNSLSVAQLMEKELENLSLKFMRFGVIDKNDISPMTLKACEESDFIIIPPDNTIAVGIKKVADITWEKKKPVIVCNNLMLIKGILASIGSIDYKQSGIFRAQDAYEVLVKKINPDSVKSNAAVIFKDKIFINKQTADYFGTQISQDLASKVIWEE